MENKIEAKNLDLYYGEKHALKNVSLNIKTNIDIVIGLKLKLSILSGLN